jgi:hypothetical protein
MANFVEEYPESWTMPGLQDKDMRRVRRMDVMGLSERWDGTHLLSLLQRKQL